MNMLYVPIQLVVTLANVKKVMKVMEILVKVRYLVLGNMHYSGLQPSKAAAFRKISGFFCTRFR